MLAACCRTLLRVDLFEWFSIASWLRPRLVAFAMAVALMAFPSTTAAVVSQVVIDHAAHVSAQIERTLQPRLARLMMRHGVCDRKVPRCVR